MENYYKEGEEKFGFLSSKLYLLAEKIPALSKFYRFVTQDLESKTFKSLLDVGFGTGSVIYQLSKNNKLYLYGVDPSPYMVSIAKKRTYTNPNVTFAVGSSTYIPFDKKFDIIISSLSMHHWNDKKGSLIYLSKFLEDGGEIDIYEFLLSKGKSLSEHFEYYAAKSHMVSKTQLEAYGEEAGLSTNIKVKGNLIKATYKLQL